MEPQNNSPFRTALRTPQIKVIIIMLAILIFGGILWYLATHGRLITQNDSGGNYTLRDADNDTAEEIPVDRNGSKLLPSGKYILRYSNNNVESLRYIEIPTFLRSITNNLKTAKQRHVERVAINSLSTITAGPGSSTVSIDNTRQLGSAFIHAADDPAEDKLQIKSLPIQSLPNFIHNAYFVGFTSTTDAGTKQVQRYSTVEEKNYILTKTYKHSQDIGLIPSTTAQNNIFGVSYKKNNATSIDIYDGNELVKTIDNLKDIALDAAGNPAVSISNKYLAVGHGSNFNLNVEEDDPNLYGKDRKKDTKEYVVKIYDLKSGKEVEKLKLGKISTVESIQINNDGTYLSTVLNRKLRVYEIKENREVFAYAASSLNNPQWVSGAQLVFSTMEGGIFRVDAEERSADTLFGTPFLNFSDFDIYNNKIYFTAFDNRDSASNSPSGYTVDLAKEAIQDNKLINFTPYETNQVEIRSLNGKMYAVDVTTVGGRDYSDFTSITPSLPFKTVVETILGDNLDNWQQYTLVYGNHF